jgi:Rod binding domain-containing protein
MDLDRHMIEIAQGLHQPHDPQNLGQVRNREAIRHAAEDFEAVFLAEMMRPMFESLNTEGPFGGGGAERTYRSLMVDEYGKALSKNGGVGIAAAVERELLKIQESKQ